jgi:hypothetical protein
VVRLTDVSIEERGTVDEITAHACINGRKTRRPFGSFVLRRAMASWHILDKSTPPDLFLQICQCPTIGPTPMRSSQAVP